MNHWPPNQMESREMEEVKPEVHFRDALVDWDNKHTLEYAKYERPFRREYPLAIKRTVISGGSSFTQHTFDTEYSHDDILVNGPPRERSSADSQYPTKWKLAVIMVALCLAVFCMALDNTIIATAIPKITDEFGALDDVAWYGSGYLLTTCSFQLFFGRLYTFYSIKWVFLIAVALFELGSLLCGAAPSSVAFIVGRAIAGIGSAGLFSGGILIIANTVPLRRRPIFTGLVGSMYGIASVAGPLLGGVFVDNLSWRWCFYINLPIGFVTVIFIVFFLRLPPRTDVQNLTWKQKVARLDLPGTIVFVPCIICLLLALQWGGATHPWNDGRVIALLVMFGLLLIAFIFIQRWQGDNGTIPPRVILQRSVGAAAWFAFCVGGAFFVAIYFVPIWFQAIKGTTATQSGINSLPMILGVTIFSVVSGVGVTLIGYYTPWMIASSVFMAIGCGLLSTFKNYTGSSEWIGYQAIVGMGLGMGFQNPLIVVQTVLPAKDVPTGTALIICFQSLGGALFLAVAQSVFLNQLVKEIQVFIPGVTAEFLLQLGATASALKGKVSPAILLKVLVAYNNALDQTFYVATAAAALSIAGSVFIEWKSVKGVNILGALG